MELNLPMSNQRPENLLNYILEIKSMLIVLVNGGHIDDARYQELRALLIQSKETRRLLPNWALSNIDEQSLSAHFNTLHLMPTRLHSYIAEELEPAIDYLLSSDETDFDEVTNLLTQFDESSVNIVWKKALRRKNSDPEGAITASRTLIEEVCKHILDDLKVEYDEKWDLPKLYSNCAKSLNLSPSQHTEQQFKQILGGCQSVVEGIGSLRNKLSDAHGSGKRKVKPAPRHAALAVNLAGSMAMFLVETLQAIQSKA